MTAPGSGLVERLRTDAIWHGWCRRGDMARNAREAAAAFDEIEYHAEQLSTYIAQPTISEKHLASARHHNDKIRAALAKVKSNV